MHTTFCRFSWSWAEQLLYQAILLLDSMLSTASVEDGEGPYGHAKFPEPPKEEAALFCLLDCPIDVGSLGQVVGYRHSEKLDPLNPLKFSSIDVDW
eukprot:g28330.t1